MNPRLAAFIAAIWFLISWPAFAAFNTVEKFSFSNISVTTAAFTLRGGNYGLTCHATFGGGNIALQRLSPDGSTFVTVITALTADGYSSANLPSGSYRLQITTATAVYCDVVATVTTQ
jgi:hypothetical protein